MMGLEAWKQRFWDDPYGYLTKLVMLFAAAMLAWGITPGFPLR